MRSGSWLATWFCRKRFITINGQEAGVYLLQRNDPLNYGGITREVERACAENGFRVSIRPLRGGPGYLSASIAAFGSIRVASSRTTPVCVTRSQADVRSDTQEFFALPFHFGHGFSVDQGGREHSFETGGTRLIAGNSPYSLTQQPRDGISETFTLAIPAEELRSRVNKVDDRVFEAISPESPGYIFLANYLRHLSLQGPEDQSLQAAIGGHLFDLVALLLQADKERAEQADEAIRSVRRRRLHQLLDHQFTDPGLDLERVAQQLGISRRYVQLLLETAGTNFSDELCRRRIDKALALISDPRSRHRKMTDIAFDCGFADLSTFNRSFRRVLGNTPSSWRRLPEPKP